MSDPAALRTRGLQSIAQQLADLRLGQDEILALLRRIGVSDATIIDLLHGLGTEETGEQTALTNLITDGFAQVQQGIIQILTTLEGPQPGPAARLIININPGGTMATGAIAITSSGHVSWSWLDVDGNPTPDPPLSGDGGAVTVALAVSNPAIATLTADATVADEYDIAPASVGGAVESTPGSGAWTPDGSVTITATATDDQGAPAVFADGSAVTATPAPFGVFPGPAGQLAISTPQ